MATAKIDGIELKGVHAQTISRETPAEKTRTAGFKLRRDYPSRNAPKRVWTLECRPQLREELYQLIQHLDSILWSRVEFELDEMEESVMAYVDEGLGEDRTQFSRDGEWINDGREYSITIEEA